MVKQCLTRGPRGRGFTLVEVTVSMIIISVMVVAALRTVGGAARARAIVLEQRTAQFLASDLMSEVMQNVFEEPVDAVQFGRESGESGGTRANYDDVDDYDGWSENAIVDKRNASVPGFSGWKRQVSVRFVEPTTMLVLGSSPATTLKQVTVVVTSPGGKTTRLMALRGKGGSYDAAPATDMTSVVRVGMRLRVGKSSPAMIAGVDLLNMPPE